MTDFLPMSYGYAGAVSELLGDLDVSLETEAGSFAGGASPCPPQRSLSSLFPALPPFYFRVNSIGLSTGGMVLWSS